MAQLDSRIALITGAARGIGAATARRLAAGGAKLVLADLDKAGVEKPPPSSTASPSTPT